MRADVGRRKRGLGISYQTSMATKLGQAEERVYMEFPRVL